MLQVYIQHFNKNYTRLICIKIGLILYIYICKYINYEVCFILKVLMNTKSIADLF